MYVCMYYVCCIGTHGVYCVYSTCTQCVSCVRKMCLCSMCVLIYQCQKLQELDVLEDDAVVYKLVGPVLVKQELAEAKQTLEKRLEYINKEL